MKARETKMGVVSFYDQVRHRIWNHVLNSDRVNSTAGENIKCVKLAVSMSGVVPANLALATNISTRS